ncbi:MAG: AbrB/MazE/SpoVT family DNA-binding domain-containing protein [Clostridia bacterium]|nr:AbrB/MazE/SpoVT family DNA-binding domain-containing protein [Clostridia bacterium]MBQ7120919.1 AbrB/MazE/SpoVT family DNA-binding domain-containing protein [Clostridia bacterium]
MYAGFIREIDSVGRIVIPMQLRKELGLLDPGSKLELFCDGKQIVAKKAVKDCVFCGSSEELIELDGKYICRACLDKLKGE